jgi:hypothetical protein
MNPDPRTDESGRLPARTEPRFPTADPKYVPMKVVINRDGTRSFRCPPRHLRNGW